MDGVKVSPPHPFTLAPSINAGKADVSHSARSEAEAVISWDTLGQPQSRFKIPRFSDIRGPNLKTTSSVPDRLAPRAPKA